MFNCSNSDSKQHTSTTNDSNDKSMDKKENQRVCRIKEVMANAESVLHQFLENQTIQSILDKANKDRNNPLHKK